MCRQNRGYISSEYGSYHIMSRTVGKQMLLGDIEKEYFQKLMERLISGFFVKVHGYCIMSNHFHIQVTSQENEAGEASWEELLHRYRLMFGVGAEPPVGGLDSRGKVVPDGDGGKARLRRRLGNISNFIQELKQIFSRWYNKGHDRKGCFWDGRFKSIPVSHSDAWLYCKIYIDLNPVRAGLVSAPDDYRWSSLGLWARNPRRAKQLLHPGIYEMQNQLLLNPDGYRVLVYRSGAVSVEGKKTIPMKLVQDVIKFHGKLGIGDRLSYRMRNFSEGIALGSYEFIRAIQEKTGKKFIRPRQVVANTELYSTRVLKC